MKELKDALNFLGEKMEVIRKLRMGSSLRINYPESERENIDTSCFPVSYKETEKGRRKTLNFRDSPASNFHPVS